MNRPTITIEHPGRFAARMAFRAWTAGFFAGVAITLAVAIVFK